MERNEEPAVETGTGFDIEMDRQEVLRFLGYAAEGPRNGSLSSLIDDEIAEAYTLIDPFFYRRLVNIEHVRDPEVTLEGGLALSSSILTSILCHCSHVAVFVATIGSRLEERVTELMSNGQMLKGAVLDAVGSEAVERTTCFAQDRLADIAAARGNEMTLRYSPGYCDWDICQQRVLFQIMGSAQAEVRLSEECLMTPRKSVSGLIGLGDCETYQLSLSACLDCTRKDCPIRR